MGLSAAQARLLTITARKSDCEFQSMSLSHQKIALSRDMERISSEYQNSLNNTKLVYDYTGSNTSNMDVSYGLLMTPSIYNDYYPKLVTDAKNRVVLNSSYAAAARAAGIPAEGLTGTPSSDVRNKFIEALAANDVITPAKATTIQGTTYGNTIGLGSTTNVTVSTSDCSYEEVLELIKAKTSSTSDYGMSMGSSLDNNASLNLYGKTDATRYEHFVGYKSDGSKVTDYVQSGAGGSLTLYDLLTSDTNYVLAYESERAEKTPLPTTAVLQEKIVGTSENDSSFLNWLVDQFKTIFGGSTANDAALQFAYNTVYDLVYPNSNVQDYADMMINARQGKNQHETRKVTLTGCTPAGANKTYGQVMAEVGTQLNWHCDRGYDTDIEKSAKDYIGFVYSADANKHHGDDGHRASSEVAISLTNLTEVFMTAFVQYQQGLEGSGYSYNKGKVTDANLYDDKVNSYTFTVVNGTEVTDENESLEAGFYDALFNKICMNGWAENDMIDDTSYLQEMMKSGMVYLSSISTDGNYYQGSYSTDTNISEVADTEAIAQAEAKYNTEKAKIENKEDTIDLKMKNLDTEISSLTTEYDSTKQIITKSIEKSFKRYDA